MNFIEKILQQKREIIQFIISLFFSWVAAVAVNDIPFILNFFLQSGIDEFLKDALVKASINLLALLGFTVYSSDGFFQIDGTAGVRIVFGCLGIRHFILFTVFIAVYFGSLLHKLWYVPAGLIVLFVANVIRITLVGLIQYIYPSKIDLAHEVGSYLFQWIIILALWLIWMHYFSLRKQQPNHLP